jgi:hypothetical protein
MSGAPGQLRDRAAAFGQALTEVTRRAEEVFVTQLAVIGRVEQEFLGKVAEALPRAWRDA